MRRIALAAVIAAALAGCGSSEPEGPVEIAFVSTRDGDYAIFGADRHGDGERRLTEERGDPSTPAGLFFQVEPAWSPDGTRIAFASRREGTSHIYVMRADGTGTRRVTGSPKDDDHPTWSPDGRRIAFAREGALFVVPAAGGTATRLAPGPGAAANPVWSPDGKLVAYDYRQPGFSFREVWVVGAGGRGAREVTKLRRTSGNPSWSPDSRRIAFASNVRDEHFEIYSIGLNGAGLRRMTHTALDTVQPAWSPDGQLIAFTRGGSIWTVDRNGEEMQISSGQNDSAASWRPLGR